MYLTVLILSLIPIVLYFSEKPKGQSTTTNVSKSNLKVQPEPKPTAHKHDIDISDDFNIDDLIKRGDSFK